MEERIILILRRALHLVRETFARFKLDPLRTRGDARFRRGFAQGRYRRRWFSVIIAVAARTAAARMRRDAPSAPLY